MGAEGLGILVLVSCQLCVWECALRVVLGEGILAAVTNQP